MGLAAEAGATGTPMGKYAKRESTSTAAVAGNGAYSMKTDHLRGVVDLKRGGESGRGPTPRNKSKYSCLMNKRGAALRNGAAYLFRAYVAITA